jgi:hypothetical protein
VAAQTNSKEVVPSCTRCKTPQKSQKLLAGSCFIFVERVKLIERLCHCQEKDFPSQLGRRFPISQKPTAGLFFALFFPPESERGFNPTALSAKGE